MSTLGSSEYGWSGLSLEKLSSRLLKAGEKVVELREDLKFDAVAFCGSSGAAIGFHLAIRHKIPIIYVRKSGEISHGQRVECNMPDGKDVERYLIVDDFVDSGETVKHIVQEIDAAAKKYGAFHAEPVGVFCYDVWQSSVTKKFGSKTLKIYTCRS